MQSGAYGVDHPNVAYVVHLDSPVSMTEFSQGSGRAGRGGKPALSLTIVPYVKKGPAASAEESCEGKVAMVRWLSKPPCRRSPQSEFLDGCKQNCQDLQGFYCDRCLLVPGLKPSQPARWDGILNLLCK